MTAGGKSPLVNPFDRDHVVENSHDILPVSILLHGPPRICVRDRNVVPVQPCDRIREVLRCRDLDVGQVSVRSQVVELRRDYEAVLHYPLLVYHDRVHRFL